MGSIRSWSGPGNGYAISCTDGRHDDGLGLTNEAADDGHESDTTFDGLGSDRRDVFAHGMQFASRARAVPSAGTRYGNTPGDAAADARAAATWRACPETVPPGACSVRARLAGSHSGERR